MNRDEGAREEVARLAARYLRERRASSADAAIDLAIREVGVTARDARPSLARLRAHAQALEESERGAASREQRIDATVDEMLEVLALLEEALVVLDRDAPDRPAPRVYGRAARAQFDLDPSVRIRLVTEVPPHLLAQAITDARKVETEVHSVATRFGRLDEISFPGTHASYRITRIPPRARIDPTRDLHGGAPIESADYQELLRRIPRP